MTNRDQKYVANSSASLQPHVYTAAGKGLHLHISIGNHVHTGTTIIPAGNEGSITNNFNTVSS
jgi:hypothetical protein